MNKAYKELKSYIDSFVNKDTYNSSIEYHDIAGYYLKLSNKDTKSYLYIFIEDKDNAIYNVKYFKAGIEDNKRIKIINDKKDLLLFCNEFLMFAYF